MTTLYIILGVVLVIGILIGLVVWLSGRSAKAKAEKAYADASNDMSREARQIDDDVRRASDSDLDRELRGDR